MAKPGVISTQHPDNAYFNSPPNDRRGPAAIYTTRPATVSVSDGFRERAVTVGCRPDVRERTFEYPNRLVLAGRPDCEIEYRILARNSKAKTVGKQVYVSELYAQLKTEHLLTSASRLAV